MLDFRATKTQRPIMLALAALPERANGTSIKTFKSSRMRMLSADVCQKYGLVLHPLVLTQVKTRCRWGFR